MIIVVCLAVGGSWVFLALGFYHLGWMAGFDTGFDEGEKTIKDYTIEHRHREYPCD
jgi:hypothetical protein